MALNFVSVSGIANKEELRGVGEIYQDDSLDVPKIGWFVIGYQVSYKSINQGTHGPRQPKFSELKDLCAETREDWGILPAIHYYTKNNETILSDLEKIARSTVENIGLTLLQFNTLPPTRDILEYAKNVGFEIIFNVPVSNKQTPEGGYAVWKGEGVEDFRKGNINPLIRQITERKDLINHVMFDPSHGTNLSLDLHEDSLAIRLGREIVKLKEFNRLGIVYAGGISPNNVEEIARYLDSNFPDRVSIDIESGVRRNNQLDLNLVRDYLQNYVKSKQA